MEPETGLHAVSAETDYSWLDESTWSVGRNVLRSEEESVTILHRATDRQAVMLLSVAVTRMLLWFKQKKNAIAHIWFD